MRGPIPGGEGGKQGVVLTQQVCTRLVRIILGPSGGGRGGGGGLAPANPRRLGDPNEGEKPKCRHNPGPYVGEEEEVARRSRPIGTIPGLEGGAGGLGGPNRDCGGSVVTR